jgi:hypothetical protein
MLSKTMYYVVKKRFILALEPVPYIVRHRFNVLEKRSESICWFGSNESCARIKKSYPMCHRGERRNKLLYMQRKVHACC